jgi:hypothetical protein
MVFATQIKVFFVPIFIFKLFETAPIILLVFLLEEMNTPFFIQLNQNGGYNW